jgi:hypothetical protein
LVKPGLDENCLSLSISFGRMYESKVRNLFIKGHMFKRRQCTWIYSLLKAFYVKL